jgi:hypothetical protein
VFRDSFDPLTSAACKKKKIEYFFFVVHNIPKKASKRKKKRKKKSIDYSQFISSRLDCEADTALVFNCLRMDEGVNK